MRFKGVDFFPHDARFKVIAWRRVFVGLSWVLAILSAVLLYTRGLNYGVDFVGGTLVEVQTKAGNIDIGKLRDKLGKLGLGDVQVQGIGTTGNEALIRVAEQKDDKAQSAAADKVKAAISDELTVRRTEVVGPAVSSELKRTGIIAVCVAILGILAYVWFRFEWQFAVAGVLALVHDVFITTGMFSLLWYEFDLATVAALLTLAGYSINDTVVVFDRIRENLRKYKTLPLRDVIDLSLNETLSRTIITGVTAVMVLAALAFLGGEALYGFSIALMFGIVIGTYSSIYVGAPIILLWGVKRGALVEDAKPVKLGMASRP